MGFGVVVQGLASHENYQARPLPALSAIGWVARLATTLPSFTSTSSGAGQVSQTAAPGPQSACGGHG